MKLLRNKEVRRALLLYFLVSVLGFTGAYMLDAQFGVLVLILCTVFVVIFLGTTYRRYRRISALTADLNKILHGDSHIGLERYAEGELGILQSEIYKMTVRLREQQQGLLDDKVYLANSIADISHQIRTPLTSINLLISLLSEPDITPERRQKLTHELYELLSRIDWLITTLLKISRLDAGTVTFKQEKISLQTLLQGAVAPLLVPIELRGQELCIQAEGAFFGDVAWTHEAIANIVKNCMEHTPDNGRITINASENALYTEIVIRDSGSGISQEDLPHVFERFYKGKNSDDKSFGIGLALSRTIVTGQNGTLKAENALPQGAQFTIRFYKGTV